MLVLTIPGHTAVTPMWCSASSARRQTLNVSTADFVVAYAVRIFDGR